jgi:hypothetical protein
LAHRDACAVRRLCILRRGTKLAALTVPWPGPRAPDRPAPRAATGR